MTSIRSGDSTASSMSSNAPQVSSPPTASPVDSPSKTNMTQAATLETLLFKATNPSNKLEDVNTIKQFCDLVNKTNTNGNNEGSVAACRILAHKIQSPQEREAVQALAVLEACVKSCGPTFHSEVGKFKFLNEMIKLVSPRYMAGQTPEHIKKKIIEMLFLWTREELKNEPKITEAYAMLKKQGIVKEDPVYVGGAVFASSLPPRHKEPLSTQESIRLRKLLQSKNPDDLQQANKIIKGMVQEDERKLDAMSKRHTELTMVNNNSKLLNEMLDHYDKASCGAPELDLLKELYESCEKMQPKLFRMAAESTDETETGTEADENGDSGGIMDILNSSDELTRVIDRYKMVILQGKPDITKRVAKKPSETLLDLEMITGSETTEETKSSGLLDEDLLGLNIDNKPSKSEIKEEAATIKQENSFDDLTSGSLNETLVSASTIRQRTGPSVDDLLLDGSPIKSAPVLATSNIASHIPQHPSPFLSNGNEATNKPEKSSRQRGLEELDFLGEVAIKSHLPSKNERSPQFAKRNEKLSMNELKQRKMEKELKSSTSSTSASSNQVNIPEPLTSLSSTLSSNELNIAILDSPKHGAPDNLINADITKSEATGQQANPSNTSTDCDIINNGISKSDATKIEKVDDRKESKSEVALSTTSKGPVPDVKLADLNVPISSIKPGKIPPMNLVEGGEDGISIVLHFGRDQPREHVTAIVVTIISKMTDPLTDFELKAVVPKGCKVKLQTPSSTALPAHNPFVPPAAITQVMLIANPKQLKDITLKYVLSFSVDGEPQTEMGEAKNLPI